MELKHYLDTVWRRKWIIAVTLVLAMAVVVTGTLLMTPIYSASAVLRVGTIAAGSVDYVNFDTQYGDRLMNTYVQIATTRPVLAELQARLGSGPVPAVKAEVIANTELIRLTATDPNPARASLAAQSLAEILIARMTAPGGAAGQSEADTIDRQLIQLQAEMAVVQAQYDQLATQKPPNPSLLATLQETIDLKQSIYATLLRQQAQSRLRDALQAASLSVIEPAITPLTPLQPNLLLNLSMGFLVALAGGLGLAFLVENLAPPPAIGAAREPLPSAPALTTASAAMKSEASARRS